MTEEPEHTVDSARAAAAQDGLAGWVRDFLASPGSDNAALAEELTRTLGWWTGPVRLPIERLHRLAGPPDAPVLEPVGEGEWDDRVYEMRDLVAEGWDPPPVIVAERDGQLVLEDGNHRVESLRQAGRTEAWAVVGFEDEDACARFQA
jgi:hypothetical protein